MVWGFNLYVNVTEHDWQKRAIGFPVWPNASQINHYKLHFRFASAKWNAATKCSARPLTTKREWNATRSPKIRSFKHFFDHIWKIKVVGRCTVFNLLILSSIFDCLLFVGLFFLMGGLIAWMAKFFLCPTTSWNIEIHCVSWYFMYILMYMYYLDIQLLQGQYIYIHIHSTLYLHWWFLILDCQGAFWLTSKFHWNFFSKWKCKFQFIFPPHVVAFFCVLHGNSLHQWKARQPFYRYSCLVLCPSGYHGGLILT